MLTVIAMRLRLIGEHHPECRSSCQRKQSVLERFGPEVTGIISTFNSGARITDMASQPQGVRKSNVFHVLRMGQNQKYLQTMLMTALILNLIKYHYKKVFYLHFQLENQIILLLYSNLRLCNNNSSYCFLTPYMFLELPSKLLGPSSPRCRFDEF